MGGLGIRSTSHTNYFYILFTHSCFEWKIIVGVFASLVLLSSPALSVGR